MKKESGFTLIEIIVTLVLVGIMATVAGIGIVAAVKGYMFAKNNTVIAGKAQVALSRMTRELSELRNIPIPATNAQANFIAFDKVFSSVAIGQSGTTIKLATGSAGTMPTISGTSATLVDQVATTGGLTFAYKKGAADWVVGDDITLLSHIIITLTMSGAGDGNNFTFSTTVNPRNNGNFGGVATPTAAPPVATGRCFVATAAYGNPYHPMVIILKQFRDKYLTTWSGGRALIQFYYKEGPYLADLIKDRPWACGLVRVMLLPFVGISFLFVYARGSIPLILLIIFAGIWLIKRNPERFTFMKKSIATRKGSVLIGLIVTMVIMASLGAALVSLTSTSSLNQAYGSFSQKAFYLAESGFRYAGSEFSNVTDGENDGKNENQNFTANAMNGRTLNMSEGSISFSVTPFHYVTSGSHAAGATALYVQFPGNVPTGFAIPSTGTIQIITQYRPNASVAYTAYTNTYTYSAFDTTTRRFTLSSGLLRAVPAWTSVAVIVRPSSSQTVTPSTDFTSTGNRLILTNTAASSGNFFMPMTNGKFKIQGNQFVYKYSYRVDGTTTTTLYGISNSATPTDNTVFTVTAGSSIIPNDFFTVASTGTVGGTSRTLTFITPVDMIAAPGSSTEATTSADPFTAGIDPGETGSNWYAASAGTYSVATTVAGGAKADNTTGLAALQLNSSYNYGGTGCGGNDMYYSLIALQWGQNYANFYSSWYGHENTLSYDAQVKMKLPQQDYYMAGMVFRLNLVSTNMNDNSMLGVSFLRGSAVTAAEDGIESGVVPVANVPMIVLWQKKTGTGISGMQWIAYKIISGMITFNNGQTSDPHFANGDIDCYVRGTNPNYARARVASVITTDGGVTGSLDISSLYSEFQTNDDLLQFILQTPNTARVRNTITSTSIGFDRGQTGINVGDIIRGRSSNASAVVTAVNRTGGDWNGGNNNSRASGTITITQLQGTFTTSDYLDVYRPNAAHSAHFVSYTAPGNVLTTGTEFIKDWSTLVLRIEEKLANSGDFSGQYVNDIKIYMGDTDTHGTPTGSPLDAITSANKRWSNPLAYGVADDLCDDDVQWPPAAGWSTDTTINLCKTGTTPSHSDHFTLVQGWVINPAINRSITSTGTVLMTGTTEEPNSTIRTNAFTTHGLGTFTQQEMGLQTAASGMDQYTYFDDFGVKMIGGTTGSNNGFSTPLMY